MEITGKKMKAAVIDAFGGPDRLGLRDVPIPEIGADQVLIQVEYAGVGEWDPFEREGGYAEMLGIQPAFPYILGSEGSGLVAALGTEVTRFRVGERVFAPAFLNPKGGFYAQFAAVDADMVSRTPSDMTGEQAAVAAGVGITALRGLADVLDLRRGEAVLIFGAGGGVGHAAVQIARAMGAQVFAVASGADGVELVKSLGADGAADGRAANAGLMVRAAMKAAGFDRFDAALFTAGGALADELAGLIRSGGRAAFPGGVNPEPRAPAELKIEGYYGDPNPDIVLRLNSLIESGALHPHVARVFPYEQAAEAHRFLDRHYLGKIALRVG